MTFNDGVECVGSLLIPIKEVQELSTSSSAPDNECVGSLLVQSKDLQEDSAGSPILTKSVLANLKKRHTVGTLLVSNDTLESPASPADHKTGESTGASIRRRFTDHMAGPAPKDEEADTWAD